MQKTHKVGRGWLIAASVAFLLFASGACAGQVVEAWGYGGDGELGNGTIGSSSVPVVISGLSSGITAIAGGGEHSLAVQDGAVYAWGNNKYGQLGNGTTTESSQPVAVSALSSGVTAIAAGTDHSLALQNGGLYARGFNYTGELGNGTTSFTSANPTPVLVVGFSSGVTAVAAGADHSLALQNGGLYAWGTNNRGQLGNSTTTDSSVPVAVSGLGNGVTAIAGGYLHTLAVQNGGVYAWGDNQYGELGNTTPGSTVPVAVSGLSSGVTAIAAGRYYSLAVQNGGVWAWGYNAAGQLGDGTTTSRSVPEHIDPTDLTNIIAVAANSVGFSSYALSSDGSIWDWGDNGGGELGLGNTTSEYLTPQHLLPPSGYVFTAISANEEGAVAILSPIPEPASLSLVAIGCVALLRRPRRR